MQQQNVIIGEKINGFLAIDLICKSNLPLAKHALSIGWLLVFSWKKSKNTMWTSDLNLLNQVIILTVILPVKWTKALVYYKYVITDQRFSKYLLINKVTLTFCLWQGVFWWDHEPAQRRHQTRGSWNQSCLSSHSLMSHHHCHPWMVINLTIYKI